VGITYFKLIHLNYKIKSNEAKIKSLEKEDNVDNLAEINSLQKAIDINKKLMKELEKPLNN
jgi:hypothetical protein